MLKPEIDHVLTEEEVERFRDPKFIKRYLADMKATDIVEVDNPMRREIRPRRGTDETSVR